MEDTLEGQAFLREMDEGQIHFRDRLQFALKSEFSTPGGKASSTYLQEIYLFIPQSLQINQYTYRKEDFYRDETNLIRFKTPSYTLRELISFGTKDHPLAKIEEGLESLSETDIIYELKMYGNIYRSTLREEVKNLLAEKDNGTDHLNDRIAGFSAHLSEAREQFDRIRVSLEEVYPPESSQVSEALGLVDEFLRIATENHVTGLLYFLRKHSKDLPAYQQLMKRLSSEVKRESQEPQHEEEVLFHRSELNKYLYEALSLKNTRIEVQKKHGAFIGMLAAGAAMTVYMALFVWKASTFGINSVPFVMFAVLFYILKDRIKEGMKELYYKNAYRWFPDYSTEISTPENELVGFMNESFQFLDPEKVPPEFMELRQKNQIKALAPAETIIQYKKELVFTSERALELNTIFRFNIHKFLEKAGDERQNRFIFDPETEAITEKKLPKIYLLTVLLKNTFEEHSEIKRYQIVINKSGIERVQS